jgi:hypothetical protein
MAVGTESTTRSVTVRLRVYSNGGDVQLAWRAAVRGEWEATVPRCLGYQLERRRRLSDGSWGPIEVLRNRVGFEGQRAPETAEDLSRPSSIWPFQTWQWTDHGAEPGDQLRYRVCAVRAPKGVTPGAAPLEVFADSAGRRW